jgi:hypothetical protein
MWYHPLNRDNRREAVFHKPGEYDAFVVAVIDASQRRPGTVPLYLGDRPRLNRASGPMTRLERSRGFRVAEKRILRLRTAKKSVNWC